MSSNLADDTTIASTHDVANLDDFRVFFAIDEEKEAVWQEWIEPEGNGGGSRSGWNRSQDGNASQSSWSSSGWGSEDKDKWQTSWRNPRHVHNGAATSTRWPRSCRRN